MGWYSEGRGVMWDGTVRGGGGHVGWYSEGRGGHVGWYSEGRVGEVMWDGTVREGGGGSCGMVQ